VRGLFARLAELVDQDPVQAGASAGFEVAGAGECEEDLAGEARGEGSTVGWLGRRFVSCRCPRYGRAGVWCG
jgi:hypothetical protein